MNRLNRRTVLKSGAAALAGGALHLLPAAGAQPTTATPANPAKARRGGAYWTNWSGTSACQVAALDTPADEAAVAALLRDTSGPLRCTGAGHSFSPLVANPGRILSLDRLAGVVSHDKTAMTVTLRAGTHLAQLSRQLAQSGLAMNNLPDIDSQTFAGAICTGTHGTGRLHTALHANVTALRLVTPSGQVLSCSTSQRPELLQAAQVSLGSLGVITEATVQVVPAFKLRRSVWLLPVGQMLEQAQALARQHRHFEFYVLPFTGYAAGISNDAYEGAELHHPPSDDDKILQDLRRLRDWSGRFPQLRRWLAARMIDPALREVATDQSYKLLVSPRPNKFYESEFHVPSEHGIACMREVIAAVEQHNEMYFPLEFRFVKSDAAWLSPFYQRESCSIAVHVAHGESYDFLFGEIAPIFRKYAGRPHWGKLHNYGAAELAALYPRWQDFLQLRRELDPQGRLLNAHTARMFGVSA